MGDILYYYYHFLEIFPFYFNLLSGVGVLSLLFLLSFLREILFFILFAGYVFNLFCFHFLSVIYFQDNLFYSLLSFKIPHLPESILFCSIHPKINSASPQISKNTSQFSLKCTFLSVGLKIIKLYTNT